MSYHHHDRWGSWSTRPWRVMDRWSGLPPQIWWWSNRKLFQSKTVAGGQARAQGKGPDESPWAWTMDWFDCGGTAKTVSLGPGKQAFCYCTQGIQTFTISDLHTTHFTYSCYFNFEFGRIIQGTFTWEWTWISEWTWLQEMCFIAAGCFAQGCLALCHIKLKQLMVRLHAVCKRTSTHWQTQLPCTSTEPFGMFASRMVPALCFRT